MRAAAAFAVAVCCSVVSNLAFAQDGGNASGDACSGASEARKRMTSADGGVAAVTLARDFELLAACSEDDAVLEAYRARLADHSLEADISTRLKLKGKIQPPPSAEVLAQSCVDGQCPIFKTTGGSQSASLMGSDDAVSRFMCGALHRELTGHAEVTALALARLTTRLPEGAAHAIVESSKDPDDYQWLTAAAHAQTDNGPGGTLTQSSEQGRAAFIGWTKAHFDRALRACADHRPAVAAYWIGYSLHSLQDLVAHRGISNGEHSFRDWVKNERTDCSFPDLTAAGVFVTQRFLERALATIPASCRTEIYKLQSPPRLDRAALHTEWKEERDRSFQELLRYKELGTAVSTACHANEKDTRCFIPDRWIDARVNMSVDPPKRKITNLDGVQQALARLVDDEIFNNPEGQE